MCKIKSLGFFVVAIIPFEIGPVFKPSAKVFVYAISKLEGATLQPRSSLSDLLTHK